MDDFLWDALPPAGLSAAPPPASPAPPLPPAYYSTAIEQWVLGGPGESCDTACAAVGQGCFVTDNLDWPHGSQQLLYVADVLGL